MIDQIINPLQREPRPYRQAIAVEIAKFLAEHANQPCHGCMPFVRTLYL
jgi:hypothetical protein